MIGLWAALAVLALTVGLLCFYCLVFVIPMWGAEKKRAQPSLSVVPDAQKSPES